MPQAIRNITPGLPVEGRPCHLVLAVAIISLAAGCSSPSTSHFLDGKLGRHSAQPLRQFAGPEQDFGRTRPRAAGRDRKPQTARAHNVENQLIRAEEDLARLDDHRKNGSPKLASSKHSRESAMPAELSTRLADLADRYPSLHYDEESGVSKFDTDVLFDSGEARLTTSAHKMLGEFAEIFQAPEARDLKIMVVGHTDARGIKGREARSKYPNNWHLSASRAVSVVDCLREAGLPESKMGIAGFAQYQPIGKPNRRAAQGPQEEPPGRNLRRRPRNASRRLDRDTGKRLSVGGSRLRHHKTIAFPPPSYDEGYGTGGTNPSDRRRCHRICRPDRDPSMVVGSLFQAAGLGSNRLLPRRCNADDLRLRPAAGIVGYDGGW